jgi:hypothetical protein
MKEETSTLLVWMEESNAILFQKKEVTTKTPKSLPTIAQSIVTHEHRETSSFFRSYARLIPFAFLDISVSVIHYVVLLCRIVRCPFPITKCTN